VTTSGSNGIYVTPQQEPGECHDSRDRAARRTVLEQIGRFAYAAPALALLAQPKHAQAGYGGGGGGGGGSKPGNGFGDTNHSHSGPPGQNKKP
jgi:hypothetical protein